MDKKPVTAIIVGAGHRAMVYSKLALTNPELLKIVGVADPNPFRRKHCMEKFGFSEDMCFENADELAKKGCNVHYPKLKYCTDNAAMIGSCACFMIKRHVLLSSLTKL